MSAATSISKVSTNIHNKSDVESDTYEEHNDEVAIKEHRETSPAGTTSVPMIDCGGPIFDDISASSTSAFLKLRGTSALTPSSKRKLDDFFEPTAKSSPSKRLASLTPSTTTRQPLLSRSSSSPNSNIKNKSSITSTKQNGGTHNSTSSVGPKKYDQLVLDLGQRNAGMKLCSDCGMSYANISKEDEALHMKYHNSVMGGVDYPVSMSSCHMFEASHSNEGPFCHFLVICVMK
jgi:hypothetical protein